MQPRSNLVTRIVLSLAITSLVVIKFYTMPMGYVGPSSAGDGIGDLPKAALSQFRMTPVSAIPNDPRDARLLQCAFAGRIADLLRTWVIPLDSKGENTLTNVMLAATSVDFTILRPNEDFSFNEVVGIRTAEKGYVLGGIYSNGEMIQGIGGGICMVSTALYNLALETGLQIVERHPHSGPVKYADPGRDAAVSFGWADLRFRNDTQGVLIIRSLISADNLVVAFYGTQKAGRSVEIVSEGYEELPLDVVEELDPSVPDGESVVKREGRPGFRVTTVRVFSENGKVVKREVVSRDTILPKNRIVLVHSASEGAAPGYLPLDLPALPSLDSVPQEVLPLPDMTPSSEPAPTPEPQTTAHPLSRIELPVGNE